MLKYLLTLGVALTQTLGAIAGIVINACETTSAACYRRREEKYPGKAYKLINSIYFLQDDHCKASSVKVIERANEMIRAYGGEVIATLQSDEAIPAAIYSEKTPLSKVNTVSQEEAGTSSEETAFDAQAYFDKASLEYKLDMVEGGLRSKLTPEQRREVLVIASRWFYRDVKPRATNGM